ncbi:MAG: ABC transporter substrate-binding protein [Lachnospiraceae bacterium]
MSKRKKYINLIGCLLFMGLLGLGGCGSPSSVSDADAELVYKSSMELQYAKNFAVDYYEGGYKMLTITADGTQFLIVPEEKNVPQALDENIVVLHQPLGNLYLVASAAMDMFRELDAIDQIRFSGQKADSWYIEEARAAMEKGSMLYAGKYSMPDYELIVSEGCSLAIENTMISHSPEVIEKLKEFGIPVLIDYSSYETHPLGRVEWIKVYGALLGKEKKADAAFAEQTDALKYVGKEAQTDKTVAFFYITSNGTANVRKTSDYIPQMIDLAGGSYIFQDPGSDEDHRSSVNMTMEEFYATAKDADYLVYNSTIDGEIQTVEQLLGKSTMLRDFKAVREGNVWCTTSDLYQHSMSVGSFTMDLHAMLTADRSHEYKYLYSLK